MRFLDFAKSDLASLGMTYFMNNQYEGKRGEDLAVEYLKKQGFTILDRNFRIRGGEIDIVGVEGSGENATLAFIEVKTRSSADYGSPLEAITPWKLRSLVKTAQFYKLKHKGLPNMMRIDAVSVKIDYTTQRAEIELVRNISD